MMLLAKKVEGSRGEKPGRLEKNLPSLDLGCQHDFGVLYFEIWCSVLGFVVNYMSCATIYARRLHGIPSGF